MHRLIPMFAAVVFALTLTGCNFFEFIQSATLDTDEGIDQYRTGCVIDEATLTRQYVQYDQMARHFRGATPTPRPIRSAETEQAAQFKRLWEAGCETGRRDVVGREQATLLQLQDEITVLQQQLDQLTETPTPIATPTPDN